LIIQTILQDIFKSICARQSLTFLLYLCKGNWQKSLTLVCATDWCFGCSYNDRFNKYQSSSHSGAYSKNGCPNEREMIMKAHIGYANEATEKKLLKTLQKSAKDSL